MKNVFACPHCSGPIMLSTVVTPIAPPNPTHDLPQQALEMAAALLAEGLVTVGAQAARMSWIFRPTPIAPPVLRQRAGRAMSMAASARHTERAWSLRTLAPP